MYPRIHWELVAEPLGSAEYTLGTSAAGNKPKVLQDTICSSYSQLPTIGEPITRGAAGRSLNK